MAEVSGAALVAKQLKASGIDHLFTVLGGPMIDVLAEANAHGIRVVNCRHEMNAAFAASSWGYLNQKPGIMVAASGPAMTNTVTPLYVATQSAMPLIVLGGSAAEGQLGLGAFQEIDQTSFANPASKWVQRVDKTEHIPELLYLAMGKAQYGRPGGRLPRFPRQPRITDGRRGGRANPRGGAPRVVRRTRHRLDRARRRDARLGGAAVSNDRQGRRVG